jgi:8-oxo-dGTP pyrophosphatase MutT (NUDIX family)
MGIRIKITSNGGDTKNIVKIVLIDQHNRVLFLKRSEYKPKFAGEWDLPGGHIKTNENLNSGLKREVFEETSLQIDNPVFIKKIENTSYFFEKYNSQPIKISHEHVDYKFLSEAELDPDKKFDKIALEIVVRSKNGDLQ